MSTHELMKTNLNLTLTACTAVVTSLLTLGAVHLAAPPNAAAAATTGTTVDEADLRQSIDRAAARAHSLEQAVEQLGTRLRDLEEDRTRMRTEPSATPTSTPEPVESAVAQSAGLTGPKFRALMGDVLRASRTGTASAEDQARFWAEARQGKALAKLLKVLEDGVGQQPNDADLRMELADAYVAKLLTVPSGPERGIWGMKAEKEWQEAIDIDADHWDAQYSLAFNYSMYPDFLNKTGAAIEQFSKALAIQKRKPHDPRYAQTYLGLARMHKKKGSNDEALVLMREAANLYPKNEQVAQTLAELEKAHSARK